MASDDDVTELREWLTRLSAQVRQLGIHRHIWEEVQSTISANAELRLPSHFYAWLKDMYVAGMAMAIRRQLDGDSRTMSLRRFLIRIKGDPSVVSRTRYRALYDDDETADRSDIDATYDRFVGPGKSQPADHDIQQQIDDLRTAAGEFVAFADQVIAHDDRERPTSLPTFAEVDLVVAHMQKLVQHYIQLFEATHRLMEPNLNYDWKAIFRTAWIPGRTH